MKTEGLREAVARSGSLSQTLKTVAWSFLGIRKRAGHATDLERVNPVHLVIAALLAAAVFIGGLLLLVRYAVTSGVAG